MPDNLGSALLPLHILVMTTETTTLTATPELAEHTDRSLLIVEDDKPFLERLARAMEPWRIRPARRADGVRGRSAAMVPASLGNPYEEGRILSGTVICSRDCDGKT